MQGEVYVEPPSRGPLPFALGEAMDAGAFALKRDGVVLTAAHVIAAIPGMLAAFGARWALGEPRFPSREYIERSLVLSAVGVVLSAFFRGGLAAMAIRAARGQRPSLGDLARGLRWFPAMLALEALHALVLVLSAPLLFVPYAFVWTALALAPFWLVDEKGSLGESLRRSWSAARGERWHLIGFFLAAAVVEYLGVLLCCVGVFPASALTDVARAHVYLRLSGERDASPQ